ncbi:GlgB N-terminal domain-containing protein, partial [Achromobacter xylosoxidans]
MSRRNHDPRASAASPHPAPAALDAAQRAALLAGAHDDPFAVLGPHDGGVRALLPGARSVTVVAPDGARFPLADEGDGLFSGPAGPARAGAGHSYQLDIEWPDARQHVADTYAFGPLLPAEALQGLRDGDWRAALAWLGVRPASVDGVDGVRCAVWAPNARRVALVGDFNSWDPRRHGMRLRHEAGV